MEFACVDIGGTNTVIGVGNDDFEIVEKVDSRAFLKDISGTLNHVLRDSEYNADDVETIAVAAAGPIDREKGMFYPPNLEAQAVNLRKPMQRLGADVHIVNDCNSAVIGEYVYGDHDVNDLVYVTISTGIGAGIIVNGDLVEGQKGNFGEIGHIVVDNQGMECGCGGVDHWEAYCSGKNLPRMAKQLFGYEFDNARTLFQQYYNGDEKAAEVVQQMQEYNARGIGSLVNAYNPEKIVVGGGVALNHGKIVAEDLHELVRRQSVNGVPDIETCELEEESVIHGLRAVANGKIEI